jgi:hypothetical protein
MVRKSEGEGKKQGIPEVMAGNNEGRTYKEGGGKGAR